MNVFLRVGNAVAANCAEIVKVQARISLAFLPKTPTAKTLKSVRILQRRKARMMAAARAFSVCYCYVARYPAIQT